MRRKVIVCLVGLIVIGLFSSYLNQHDINSLLESAFGVKTVEVDELKQMAEKGEIPYELYKLALYEKLRNPDVLFKYAFGKVYVFENGSNYLLEGRYIERINDTWYRVVVVFYDDLFTEKYCSVKVNVSTELRSGYGVDYPFLSYLRLLHKEKGIIEAKTENGVVSRELEVLVYKNINPEDRRIAEEIANQILDFACENGLTKSQAVEFTYLEFVPFAIEYLCENEWMAKPITFIALNGDKLVKVRLNISDSLMKSFLLHGKGSCYVQTFVAVHVVNSMGVRSAVLELFRQGYGEYHAFLAIPYDQVEVNKLKGSDSIVPAVIEINKKQTRWLIYDVGRPYEEGYQMYLDDIISDKTAYLVSYLL